MRGIERPHSHLDTLTLPDGTRVVAASLAIDNPYQRAAAPDFGLYLDPRWQPSWPHSHLTWPDMGVPADGDAAAAALRDLLARARAGQNVELGCIGGHGRTGTALACLAVLTGLDPSEAVRWVRASYCPQAIENVPQEVFVAAFTALGQRDG
jgi:Protein-tyrosine phosphatase